MSNQHIKNNNKLLDAALSILISESKTNLLCFLNKLISSGEAEEIAQEAYLKLYLLVKDKPNHHNYVELLLSLRPMLTVIAKNLALSAIRHKKVEGKYAESKITQHEEAARTEYQSHLCVEERAITENESIRLIAAINCLPPICREVFVQRKLHNKSHQHIANVLKISTKTVESHLSKGLVLCRKHMLEHTANLQGEHANSARRLRKVAS